MPNVSVLIPWGGEDPWRMNLRDYVVTRILCLHPKFQIILGACDEQPFNRGTAINNAAEQATGDILVVWDADTVSNRISLEVAVQFAEEQGFSLPYGHYYNLTESRTKDILALSPHWHITRPTPEESEHDLTEAVSGIVCFRRDVFEGAHPFRSGFIGWGYEDRAAYELALDRAGGVYRREAGYVLHLWHRAPEETNFGQPNIQHNRTLYRQLMKQNGLPIRVP